MSVWQILMGRWRTFHFEDEPDIVYISAQYPYGFEQVVSCVFTDLPNLQIYLN